MAVNWDEIRLAYVTGSESLRSVAKAFCVSSREVFRHSKLEGWPEKRRQHSSITSAEALARIREEQVNDQMKLYDRARAAAENIIKLIEDLSTDPESFHLHAVQREQSTGDSRDKWVEDVKLKTVNGKNLADIAKALTSITPMVRILDRIVEAPTQAKLDIDREKLELDKRRAGMNDDLESESGIVELPAVDDSILDTAIPDPEQPQDGA